MEERSDQNGEKIEEIMLPGFRFHPTDEELVGFYLKRKIQQRPLSIELIKQLDIYKHDPWDLPKLAMTGEKEWYFYCPRDRKYRNSARPNRVTGAGFWKATGTDRPIYTSEGSKCIGLKKSLVFYKGRAAKGVKTDWMMHEFRLPSLTDHTTPSKRFLEKTIPANDSWAICRIFKKASSTVQRTLSHSWVSPILQETTLNSSEANNNILSQHAAAGISNLQHSSCITTTSFSSAANNIMDQHTASNNSMPLYKPFSIIDPPPPTLSTINNKQNSINSSGGEDVNYYSAYNLFQDQPNYYSASKSSSSTVVDHVSSLLLNNMPIINSSSIFGDIDHDKSSGGTGLDYNIGNNDLSHQQYLNGCCFSITTSLPHVEIQENCHVNGGVHQEPAAKGGPNEGGVETVRFEEEVQWGRSSSSGGYPFMMSLPLGLQDAWKSSFLCDSSSDISSGFSTTNKCYI